MAIVPVVDEGIPVSVAGFGGWLFRHFFGLGLPDIGDLQVTWVLWEACPD